MKIINNSIQRTINSCNSYLMLLLVIGIALGSCKKLAEVPSPYTTINVDNVYKNDATAAAVLTGIYAEVSNGSFVNGGFNSLSLFPSLSSDELSLINGSPDVNYIQYYRNSLSNALAGGYDFWSRIYPFIYTANAAVQGIEASTLLTPIVKDHLLGEAKFIRAFCYFYLVNLYGDVPLVLGTDYKNNSMLPRSPKQEIYDQIVIDLKDAEQRLPDTYVDATTINPSTERTRPNKWAAKALLSRVYLYREDWASAEDEATAVLSNTSLYSLTVPDEVFLSTSPEAIWQLQPVRSGENTPDARLFTLPESGPDDIGYPVYLNAELALTFEENDLRRQSWVDSVIVNGSTYYFPFKYKVSLYDEPVTEYVVVFRLAEQYLIRAEARLKQNKLIEAVDDVNIVRARAGLNPLVTSNSEEIFTAIMHERQVELFTEWGHRWLDLKRTGLIDAVMPDVTSEKGGQWNSNAQLYPIPLTELQTAPNLTQNPGY